ncbi:hypothetical protein PCANC_26488 [Puccinia coronata f. sp. avenae]|uniref:5'-3' DNA helicase ZGRF1-like N-terminal domain-containing protein n=1 Tax=Puccinia coronata f. sp. avenae TaxID=200324 RepID=A0A2N5S1Z3_9BASI|nr:hypothetical protein PCANC_26488 [Puccinia coronata f. sp. avenae]
MNVKTTLPLRLKYPTPDGGLARMSFGPLVKLHYFPRTLVRNALDSDCDWSLNRRHARHHHDDCFGPTPFFPHLLYSLSRGDLQKHRKVWHDGFIRMRHVNSKVYLQSEDGHTLAESFIKISASRAQPERSPDRLNYAKVHAEFCLDEDEEIVFDPVEDSELRPSSYAARIVNLVSLETENVPLHPALNPKARQDLHKRKMEYLDQTIQQFTKRGKPGCTSPETKQLSSDPATSSSLTPLPPASRRKISGFQSRPFNSPLMNKSMPSSSTAKPSLEPLRPPLSIHKSRPTVVPPPPQSHAEPQMEIDPHHIESSNDEPALQEDSSSSSPPHPVHSRPSNRPALQPKLNLQQKAQLPKTAQSSGQSAGPNRLPESSSSSSSTTRVSEQKTLKINWDSFFMAAKP